MAYLLLKNKKKLFCHILIVLLLLNISCSSKTSNVFKKVVNTKIIIKGRQPHFSPNNKLLAFYDKKNGLSIFDFSKKRVFFKNKYAEFINWNPDSKRIAYLQYREIFNYEDVQEPINSFFSYDVTSKKETSHSYYSPPKWIYPQVIFYQKKGTFYYFLKKDGTIDKETEEVAPDPGGDISPNKKYLLKGLSIYGTNKKLFKTIGAPYNNYDTLESSWVDYRTIIYSVLLRSEIGPTYIWSADIKTGISHYLTKVKSWKPPEVLGINPKNFLYIEGNRKLYLSKNGKRIQIAIAKGKDPEIYFDVSKNKQFLVYSVNGRIYLLNLKKLLSKS